MINLFTGDFSPDGYIFYDGNGTGYIEEVGAKTSLPINVTSGRVYEFSPVGGTSTRCRCIEILKNGQRRDYNEYPDIAWTKQQYTPRIDVAAIQIYYKRATETVTGLMFYDATIDNLIVDNFIESTIVKTGLTAIPAAKLDIDLDPDAERLVILDRKTAERLYYCKVNELFKEVILPARYGIDPLLTCIILDDDLAYTGAILDGVIAEITDLSQ